MFDAPKLQNVRDPHKERTSFSHRLLFKVVEKASRFHHEYLCKIVLEPLLDASRPSIVKTCEYVSTIQLITESYKYKMSDGARRAKYRLSDDARILSDFARPVYSLHP